MVSDLLDLAGRTALITSVGQGIGVPIAEARVAVYPPAIANDLRTARLCKRWER